MKTLDEQRAELEARHRAALAEIESAAALADRLPVRPDRVQENGKLGEAWAIYKAASITDALAILDAYPEGEPGACVESGCTYVGPQAAQKAGERGKLRWETTHGLYTVDLSQGRGFASTELSWWTRAAGELVRIKVDLDGYARGYGYGSGAPWPWRWKPTSRVTYNRDGDVSSAAHSLPTLPGEWRRIKWGAGSQESCHFAVYFDGRRSFRDMLLDVEGIAEHYELTPADVDRPTVRAFGKTWGVADFIGHVMLRDVGKRVHQRDGILQVENDEQRDQRIAAESAARKAAR